jgi:hypothetical protein
VEASKNITIVITGITMAIIITIATINKPCYFSGSLVSFFVQKSD